MTPAFLNDLTLDQLESMNSAIAHLVDSGRTLQSHGYRPIFSLMPGNQPTITLDWSMPLTHRSLFMFPGTLRSEPIPAGQPVPSAGQAASAVAEMTDAGPVWSDLPDVAERTDIQTDAAPEAGGAVTQPLPAEQREGLTFVAVTGQDGGAGVAVIRPAAPDPTPEPVVPGSVRAVVQSAKALAWTEEQDAQLIRMVVDAMAIGATKARGIAIAAAEIGRPEAGTQWRLQNKLALRFEASLAVAIADKAGKSPVALPPVSPPVAQAAPRAVIQAAVKAPLVQVPAPLADDLDAHLGAMSRKGGWSMQRDLEVMELACIGWGFAEIGAELSLDSGDVRRRFDLLTGLHRDAADKQVRRFPRADVLSRLNALCPAQASE